MTSKSKALTGLGRGDIGAVSKKKKVPAKPHKKKKEPVIDTDQFLLPPKGFPLEKTEQRDIGKGGDKLHPIVPGRGGR